MPDYSIDDFGDTGYYLAHYGGDTIASGPFDDIPALANANDLTEYPSFGYIVYWDAETKSLGSVPSLNPDELCKYVFVLPALIHIKAASTEECEEIINDLDNTIFDAGPVQLTGTLTGKTYELVYINAPQEPVEMKDVAYMFYNSTGRNVPGRY